VRLEFIQKCNPAQIRLGYGYTPDWNGSEAVKIAKMADVVVFCGGLDSEIELEGTDRGFDLPYGQDQLINALAAVNKNMIVTLLAGGGVNMSEWVDRTPAIYRIQLCRSCPACSEAGKGERPAGQFYHYQYR
jgi:beta-glucosidase